ncbi:sensor histidine kinase [Niabella hibiscisoli]|uniref:sensor histidine kinase n=1 Tax=Niabella hibiscisoli TaxID=1825928 RepID=UPI001F110719|nr:histidine kinase [Niabella hibiscisoli]MCH5721436.1 histidine kinase [Niabella hibiscisoli]
MIAYKSLGLLSKGEILITNKSLILIFLNNSLAWFSYFIIWSAVYFIYHYVSAAQREQIDNLKLKSHIKELELKTIKTHINPHFIFNALNGIRAMVDENPQRARTAITELSNILRSSINIDKSETVPLTEELNIIKDYLALEQMRFEDRLMVQYDIEDKTTSQPVPPMMLQMLVENAIKHGISHEINGGLVKLVAALSDNILELRVENTGRLKEQQQGGGFGIMSIRERLKLMYGSNAVFNIKQSSPNVVTATLRLPVTL